jgi:hypothetical protein
MRTYYPRRRLSLATVAEFKSIVSKLAMLRRLMSGGNITLDVATRELDSLQTSLYRISRTPKGSAL